MNSETSLQRFNQVLQRIIFLFFFGLMDALSHLVYVGKSVLFEWDFFPWNFVLFPKEITYLLGTAAESYRLIFYLLISSFSRTYFHLKSRFQRKKFSWQPLVGEYETETEELKFLKTFCQEIQSLGWSFCCWLCFPKIKLCIFFPASSSFRNMKSTKFATFPLATTFELKIVEERERGQLRISTFSEIDQAP